MAKRPLGQHFLIDHSIIDRIIAASDLSPQDKVLEIGPGKGALTKELCKRAGQVVAVELDQKLATALPPFPNLQLIRGNFLKCDLSELMTGPEHSWKVIANLPYYITTPIIEKLLSQASSKIDFIMIMIQREVAERMAATACRDSGSLSYFVQYYAAVKNLFKVNPGCFQPPPQVDSAVVMMKIHRTPPVKADSERLFTVTRTAFRERRKTLRRSLKSLAQIYRIDSDDLLKQAGISGERRPETLTLEEFSRLAEQLPKQ